MVFNAIIGICKKIFFFDKTISFLVGIIVGGLVFSYITKFEYDTRIIPTLIQENEELKSKYNDAVIKREEAKASLVKFIEESNKKGE